MVRLLVFIHGFPQLGGRCVWLINRLPELGFEVEIVTNRHRHDENEEMVLRQLNSNIRIHQTWSLNKTPFRVLSRFFGWYKLVSWLEKLCFFPDLYVLGVPFAVLRGLGLLRSRKFDVIMSVSPPESFHFSGWLLQTLTGVPWVANFEDLWTDKEHVFNPPTPIHRRLARIVERRLYRDCDHLIANTHGNAEHYRRNFQISREKISIITLGYEEGDSPAASPAPRSSPDRLLLGYMGAFDKSGFPWREFLSVMKEHLAQPGCFPIELRFCGAVSKSCEEQIRQLGLQANFIFEGLLPHHEAVERMRQVDALVVLMYETPYSWAIMPQKVYHYLSIRKPVIGIGEKNGEVDRILGQTASGKVTPLAELDQLRQQIWNLAEEKRASGRVDHAPIESEIRKYSIPVIAKRLAECLHGVSAAPLDSRAC